MGKITNAFLVKTITTMNRTYALSKYHLYNSEDFPDCYAVILKKGVEKGTEYTVKVYEVRETEYDDSFDEDEVF